MRVDVPVAAKVFGWGSTLVANCKHRVYAGAVIHPCATPLMSSSRRLRKPRALSTATGPFAPPILSSALA